MLRRCQELATMMLVIVAAPAVLGLMGLFSVGWQVLQISATTTMGSWRLAGSGARKAVAGVSAVVILPRATAGEGSH